MNTYNERMIAYSASYNTDRVQADGIFRIHTHVYLRYMLPLVLAQRELFCKRALGYTNTRSVLLVSDRQVNSSSHELSGLKRNISKLRKVKVPLRRQSGTM